MTDPQETRSDRKRRSRERILNSAASAMRTTGAEGVNIKQIMSAAGLTHGGFYAHFEDRDALVAAAFEAAMDQSRALWFRGLEALSAADRLTMLASRYMSRDHRDHPETGCPFPSLGSDVSRGQEDASDAAERSFQVTLARLSRDFAALAPAAAPTADAPPTPEEEATAFFALCIGAQVLARAARSDEASDATLAACRKVAKARFSARPKNDNN